MTIISADAMLETDRRPNPPHQALTMTTGRHMINQWGATDGPERV